jgi:hypothetical protein
MQPTPPAWYLDPFGQPALWRWFDGRHWTRDLSADPKSPPPPPTSTPASPTDGRYHSGRLSCAAIDGWAAAPAYLDLDAEVGQQLVVGRSNRGPYVACVFLGALPAHFETGPVRAGGDLAAAGQRYTDHLLGTYYPHETQSGHAETTDPVDGQPAWSTRVTMHIDDPTLTFETEDVTVVLVELDGSAGVLYASLPVTDGVPPVDEVVGDLRIDVLTSQ